MPWICFHMGNFWHLIPCDANIIFRWPMAHYPNQVPWNMPTQSPPTGIQWLVQMSLTRNLRSVMQEKETVLVTRPLGRLRIFSAKGYRSFYGREAADDGLTPEAWTTPTGQTIQAYKAGQWWQWEINDLIMITWSKPFKHISYFSHVLIFPFNWPWAVSYKVTTPQGYTILTPAFSSLYCVLIKCLLVLGHGRCCCCSYVPISPIS